MHVDAKPKRARKYESQGEAVSGVVQDTVRVFAVFHLTRR